MADKIVLSPTRVNRWIRCKKAYAWRYHRKLVRVSKGMPLSLGSVMSEALAGYYREPNRNQSIMDLSLRRAWGHNKSEFLGEKPDKSRREDWEKVERISKRLAENYHEKVSPKDDFEVVHTEQTQEIPLTKKVSLLAIPDAIVALDPEIHMVLEHKVRHRYRPGDFGIDYQSVASCLVSGSIGTIYNVMEYGHIKYYRDRIIRSEEELEYFRKIFIGIGEDILSTSPADCYPMPMRRCSCEYWELCNAEMQGLDIDDIISELYQSTARKTKEKEVK